MVEFRKASPEALDLLKSMLQKDPKLRPGVSECLEHCFFKEAHVKKLMMSKKNMPLNKDNQRYFHFYGYNVFIIVNYRMCLKNLWVVRKSG